MDRAETLLALKRIKTWPKEWHKLMLELPADEAEFVLELVALVDARPADGEHGKAKE